MSSNRTSSSGTTPLPLLTQVKAVVPASVKAALRPAVRVVAPSLVNSAPKGSSLSNAALSFCDQPTDNPWSVVNPDTGLTHRYFFLCGCWKSGTHWMQRILNLHPQVNIKGEFHFETMLLGLDRFTSPSWFVASGPKTKRVACDAMENLVRRTIYAATRNKPDSMWLGDCTPRMLRTVLPGAPTFWLLRDGRDVLVSWSFHWLRVKENGVFGGRFKDDIDRFKPEFTANPDRFRDPESGLLGNDQWVRRTAREWAKYVENDFRMCNELINSGTPVHRIVYEDLHANTPQGAERMYRFLGLDPARAQPLSRETKTLAGVEKEDLKSATRKGQTGDWRNYFNDRITRIFKEEAGQALVQAGYEKDLNW